MMNDPVSGEMTNSNVAEKKWAPLTRLQRRVAGVLVEKSKTTPAAYPMTLNAIRTACNQKSNRYPQMDLGENEIENTLDELRQLGAVAEVHTGGRVPKYKHYLYEWLGVEKAELGVMTELLLRGEQSLGDLRARSARMEKIAGLEELKPIIDNLIATGLMIELTPPGRGQMVTHNLYLPDELDRLRSGFEGGVPDPVEQTGSSNALPAISRDTSSDQPLKQMEQQIVQLQQAISEIHMRLESLEQGIRDNDQ